MMDGVNRVFDAVSSVLTEAGDWRGHSCSPTTAATSVVVVVGGVVLVRVAKNWWKYSKLAKKRTLKKKRWMESLQKLENKVKTDCKLSKERVDEILSWSLVVLRDNLQNGGVTATDALHAYQLKTVEVNKDINGVVEVLWEAEDYAAECDASDTKGPLHGIPITIKDNFMIKGYDATVGLSLFIDKPSSETALMVKILRQQGAIPFVKTNVPQTMISYETTNPIFGATRNPHNLKRAVGGSSGGECAMVAAGASILGFGSDIGGSIRIPSAFCGTCGLKPTANRLSAMGTQSVLPGQTVVGTSFGPISKDVDSLVIAMRYLMIPDMFKADTLVPPIPFREDIYSSKKPLRIGFFTQDGFFRAVPAMERAVHVAKTALEKLGHQVVPADLPGIGPRTADCWAKSVFGDQGAGLLRLTDQDAADSSFALLKLLLQMNNTLKKLLIFVIKRIYPKMSTLLEGSMGSSSVENYWKVVTKVQSFRIDIEDAWRSQGLDAVICPGFSCPALLHDEAQHASGAVSYTGAFNVLNFPAGSLPVSKVTKSDEENMADYSTEDLWHKRVKQNMVGSEGLPLNVQVVALPWQEEQVLRVMKDIETGVKQ